MLSMALAGLVATQPAQAQTFNLLDLFGQIQQYSTDLHNYVQTTISSFLSAAQGELQSAVNGAIGSLGLPDPIKVRATINLRNSKVDPFEFSATIRQGSTGSELDRQITRGAVGAVLGVGGQTRTQSDIDFTNATISESASLSDQAQSAVATQDVMKFVAQQMYQQTEIMGALRNDNLYSRQDAQFTNLNLANISAAMDQESRMRRSGMTNQAMQNVGFSSQLSLF